MPESGLLGLLSRVRSRSARSRVAIRRPQSSPDPMRRRGGLHFEAMIDYEQFGRWLVATQKSPDATEMITISVADAICLRTFGFWNVEPGRWQVPSLPPELRWRYPALASFTTNVHTAPGAPVAPASVQDRGVPATAAGPATAVPALLTASSRHDMLPLTARLVQRAARFRAAADAAIACASRRESLPETPTPAGTPSYSSAGAEPRAESALGRRSHRARRQLARTRPRGAPSAHRGHERC